MSAKMFSACALFANFENPFGDTARAFRESVDTIVHAEALGFEQVWLTEHHFNAFSVSASLLPLLAYLAARTTRIKLGTGALLLPFHNPVRAAEDLATIDALSGGRLLLGVGRGGPFPEQFKQFGVDLEQSRTRLFEALDLIERISPRCPSIAVRAFIATINWPFSRDRCARNCRPGWPACTTTACAWPPNAATG